MYKKLTILILGMWTTRNGFTQITPSFRMPQYSMAAFQPTALPYNQFDKIDGDERTDNGDRNKQLALNYFLNVSTRVGLMKDWQSSTTSSYKKECEATSISFDYMPNHEFSADGKAKIRLIPKLGIGLLRYNWQNLQMNIPYANLSAMLPLNNTGSKKGDWRLAGGLCVRYSMFNSTSVNYLDKNDPDIQVVERENRAGKIAFALSAAIFNIKRMYLGMGFNWVDGFASKASGTSMEFNLLAQYAWGNAMGEDKMRTLLGHHHSSLVVYKLVKEQNEYPLYAQFNHRFTIQDHWWIGAGVGGHPKEKDPFDKWQVNLDKWQVQVGFLLPKNTSSQGKPYDLHWWLTTHYDASVLRQHGLDFNIGIAF